MDILYQQKDYQGLGTLLSEIKKQDASIVQTQFTDNFTINAILQDASLRAAQMGTTFDAQVHVSPELTIPENDLCMLLMNMLDNALEACAQMKKTEGRFIHFKAEMKNGFLAVKCENAYAGEIKEDSHGHLITTKANPEAHGFGMLQMSAVAEQYHSMLDISFSESHVFTVQTALKLPKKKEKSAYAAVPS